MRKLRHREVPGTHRALAQGTGHFSPLLVYEESWQGDRIREQRILRMFFNFNFECPHLGLQELSLLAILVPLSLPQLLPLILKSALVLGRQKTPKPCPNFVVVVGFFAVLFCFRCVVPEIAPRAFKLCYIPSLFFILRQSLTILLSHQRWV